MIGRVGPGKRKGVSAIVGGIIAAVVIVVIVAAVSGFLLLRQTQNTSSPPPRDLGYIEIEVRDMVVGNTYDFNITAYDTNGKPLEGVEISLAGCGVDIKKLTDRDGKASFYITPRLPENVHTGEIKVTAVYTGTTMKVVADIITVQRPIILEPLGMHAKYVNWQKVSVSITSVPPNAFINGSSIVIKNATTGSLVQCSGTIYNAAGGKVATITAGQPVSDATTSYWQAGMTIILTGTAGVSVGDTVQIAGNGFSTSAAMITA
ncbi:MAG: hypothetical protein QXJ27_04165 [Thermoplasmata archaeon]